MVQHGSIVRRGPFEGMVYPERLVGHANVLAAKLIGAYEAELGEIIRKLVSLPCDRIVNIGAGEGYYAVGLARAIPRASVYAFETDAGERRLCRELARANGVGERVRIRGTCDLRALRETVRGSTLIVCDCEGGERELLRPDVVPGLLDATILVELHPLIDPDIPDSVTARFAATHAIRLVASEPREPAEWPEVAELDRADAALLLCESGVIEDARGPHARVNDKWALMTPHATATSHTPQ